jgi:hypothetical protein
MGATGRSFLLRTITLGRSKRRHLRGQYDSVIRKEAMLAQLHAV